MIVVSSCFNIMKFGRRLRNNAAETPTKFQSETKLQVYYLPVLRFREISYFISHNFLQRDSDPQICQSPLIS